MLNSTYHINKQELLYLLQEYRHRNHEQPMVIYSHENWYTNRAFSVEGHLTFQIVKSIITHLKDICSKKLLHL